MFSITLFVRSQSFISPPSFMFVSAADSEIRELHQNKEEEYNNWLLRVLLPNSLLMSSQLLGNTNFTESSYTDVVCGTIQPRDPVVSPEI